MTEIVLNGQRFSDLNGFYDEIISLRCAEPDTAPGRNLDALNDLLCGDDLHIIWSHYRKSRRELGAEQVLRIIEVLVNQNDNQRLLELR